MDILDEQVLEERDMDQNEEEDIIMEKIREEHQRDVAEDDEYKSNIHSLRCNVYTIEKEQLKQRYFQVFVPNQKGGGIVWIFMKDNIIQ